MNGRWPAAIISAIGVAFAMLPIGALALSCATLGTIQVDYGRKDHQIAALSIYNTIAAAIGCVAGGWLGDRFGSKRIVALAYALTALPTLLPAVQIADAGLQAVPMNLFYGIIVAHGLFFGMALGVRNTIFMGMASIAISIGNYWQGLVAESMGYSVVLYLDALFAVLVILVISLLRDREEAPARERVAGEPLLAID